MKLNKIICYLCIFCAFIHLSHAQEVLSADPLTGALQGSIPLISISSKTLSYPFATSYHTNGQKPLEGTGNMGIGWNMDDSPSIVREIRDLPDEIYDSIQSDNSTFSHIKIGWLNGGELVVNQALNGDPEDPSFYKKLDTLGGFRDEQNIYDTEPDIFHVRVPGHLSFSFILNSNGEPTILTNDSHFRIAYSKNENGDISYFEIIAPGNIRYSFGFVYTNSTAFEGDNSEGFYWKKYYRQFKEEVFYTNDWYLTEISTPSGDKLTFNYEEFSLKQYGGYYWYRNLTPTRFRDTLRVYSYNSVSNDFNPAYRIKRNRNTAFPRNLVGISSDNYELKIERGSKILYKGNYEFQSSLIDKIYLIDKRTGEQVNSYNFLYGVTESNEGEPDSYSHIYLEEIVQQMRLRSRKLYTFSYYGIDFKSNKSIFTDRQTENLDEFGFYADKEGNGALRKMYCYPELPTPHQYRTEPIIDYSGKEIILDGHSSKIPDQRIIQTGSIKSVKTNLGGIQSISYELNQYYDSLNQKDRYGGGLRVKSMIIQDGADHNRDITKSYSYVDASGQSSGKLIYKPIYAKQIPIFYDEHDETTNFYSDLVASGLSQEEIWKRMTIRSVDDLNKDEALGYNVAYSTFKESVLGLGDNIYQFNIPFSYSDKSSIPYSIGQLNQTINYVLGGEQFLHLASNSNFYSSLLNTANSDDYQWNGLLSSQTNLSASGDSITSSVFRYDRIGLDTSVSGLKVDMFNQKIEFENDYQFTDSSYQDSTLTYYPEVIFWARKSIKTRTQDMLVRKTDKVYDSNGESIATITDYFYTDSLRIREEKTTLNDGTSYTKRYKYLDDYTISGTTSDITSNAFFQMKKGWNYHQIPIEVLTIYNNGTTDKVINASLSTWQYNDSSLVKPHQNKRYQFTSRAGVEDFVPSYVSYDVFLKDARYELITEVKSRNIENQPISNLTRGIFRSGVHYGSFDEVKLAINGAYSEEVIFTDFEGNSQFSFDSYNQASLVEGRVMGKALSLGIGENITGSCVKGLDQNYVLSFWIKTDQSGEVQISITDELSGNISESISFENTQAQWVYMEEQIDVSNLTGSSLTVSLTSPATSIELDDIATYPLSASINHTLYGVGYLKLAETNTQGQTISYEYDDLYRPTVVKNKDGEIIRYNEYGDTNSFDPLYSTASIYHSGNLYHNENITFTAYPNVAGASYEWKIMDSQAWTNNPDDFSNATITSGNSYTTPLVSDDYVVKVRISYGGAVVEANPIDIRVVYETPEVSLCINRPTMIDLCDRDEVRSECAPAAGTGLLTVVAEVVSTNGSGSYTYYLDRVNPANGYGTNVVESTNNTLTVSNYENMEFRVRVRDNDINNSWETWISTPIKFSTYQSDPLCNTNSN